MKLLTILRFEGTPKVQAWCCGCHAWVDNVCVVEHCQPGDITYVYCEACGEALIRSNPLYDETCMNPHIYKVCDADCQIYTECMGKGEVRDASDYNTEMRHFLGE